jgi:peptidase E
MPPLLTRRQFLPATALAATAAVGLPPCLSPATELPRRTIFACGGGVLQGPDKPRLLLKYLLSLTGKKDPLVCFLPTAGADRPESIVAWYEAMNDLGCRPRHLRLINNSTNLKDLEQQVLSMDALFVGGGNTLSMLAIWKVHQVDVLLRKAWDKGIVLAGESAGMICWFEQGVSDSRPGDLTSVEGLGWLKGSATPHYHHKTRRPSCHRLLLADDLKAGVACDDGVGLVYYGDKFVRAVTAEEKAGAFTVRRADNKAVEEVLPIEVLGE